ncbi:hypothetical protein ALI144C_31410 [Actinosynnema sp. ALI-1.44]|uniref:AfsR/SARP family transcriptional regulator n=1 Tax=Actinosynnema sp. ALI-1.44 TaxID=1933779 RepID=UPI00097C1CB7|nr:AfsR/SARP family transcriptional regulator [Actinosynnema sp. ALI-1.44]ONI77912.1 hypothetical protein ALI144C_31410 [Actinosynnema sp. ALI-1.44]
MSYAFQVLGPFGIQRDNRDLTPAAPKLRTLAALLVFRGNSLVQAPEIVDELWGHRPPSSAIPTIRTYVHKLRKILGGDDGDTSQKLLVTGPKGYLARIPAGTVDLHWFEQFTKDGTAALQRGEARHAATACARALALWRGPALAGVETGQQLSARVVRLEETRLRAQETKIEADLRLGQHREVISELKELTRTHAVHEVFYRQLMIALHRCDRRGEALAEYVRFRKVMSEQLGLEPSPSMKRLHHALVTNQPGLVTTLP